MHSAVYANTMHVVENWICPICDYLSLQHLQETQCFSFWNQHILKYLSLEQIKIPVVEFSFLWETSREGLPELHGASQGLLLKG